MLILSIHSQSLAQQAIEVPLLLAMAEKSSARQACRGIDASCYPRHGGWGVYLDPVTVGALRSSRRGEEPEPIEPLSQRELEVLQLVLQGYTNKEMAEVLILSAETTKTHMSNILSKLQAKDRTHAAVIGLRRGLVSWV
jgi:DNA-binding NarL/FixJ family response regulator